MHHFRARMTGVQRRESDDPATFQGGQAAGGGPLSVKRRHFPSCKSWGGSVLSPAMSDQKPPVDWDRLAAKPEFHALLKRKARFIIIATVFFMTYYLALPVLVGYWPELMKKKVLGEVNIAYLFALSQFFMAWIMAFVYVRVAFKWDKLAAAVIADVK